MLQVMEKVRLELNIPAVEPVQSSGELDNEMRSRSSDTGSLIGVVFEDSILSAGRLPDDRCHRIHFQNLGFDFKPFHLKPLDVTAYSSSDIVRQRSRAFCRNRDVMQVSVF